MNIKNRLSVDELARLVSIRESIHRFPELAFNEEKTAQKVEEFLDRLDISHRRLAGTGVVADILGGQPGPIIALRGDMDALPIQENSGLSFQSEVPGVMHACGHDMHVAWLLGAAIILAQTSFSGTIRLVFQPAEEVIKGAAAMIDEGALDGVSSIFGAHVDRNFAIGQVVVQPGYISAASDRFYITITGKAAHGARPHQGCDAILAAGHLITSVQAIASRFTDPGDPVVLTIGTISGGAAPNIIADKVELSGTLRSLSESTRDTVKDRLTKMMIGIESAFGVSIDMKWVPGVPAINNGSPYIDWVSAAVHGVVGSANQVRLPRVNMAAEDFAVYLQTVPGAFVRIGVCEPGGVPVPAHSPQFYVSNDAIAVGANVMAQIALQAIVDSR